MRAGDRGGARAPGAQARAVRAVVGRHRRRRVRAGEQHLVAAGHGDRRGSQAPRAGRRHALLQSASGHAPARGGRRRAILGRGAGSGPGRRRRDGQACDHRRGRAGLPGQPVQPAVWPRGAEAAPGAHRAARGDRSHLPHGGRVSDGAVRADGPGRGRRRPGRLALVLRAELRRAALAPVADHRAHRRRGPPGAQVGARATTSTPGAPVNTARPIPSPFRPAAATG